MTQTATLTWVAPTLTYTGVEIAMRVSGAPTFTVLATIATGVLSHVIPALDDGSYDFQVTALNGTLRASGVIVSGAVVTPPVLVAPDNVSGLTVTFA